MTAGKPLLPIPRRVLHHLQECAYIYLWTTWGMKYGHWSQAVKAGTALRYLPGKVRVLHEAQGREGSHRLPLAELGRNSSPQCSSHYLHHLPHLTSPSEGPRPGGHGCKGKENPLPSPVCMVPEPGAGAGLQAVHHCIPIVQKGLVQPGRGGGERREECGGETTTGEQT